MVANFLYDDQKLVARIDEKGDVFSDADDQKVATVRDGQLYTLRGEPTGLFLQELEKGRASPDALQKLKKLLG
jgi:hypothetical protein